VGREQDSGETERDRECVRDSVLQKMRDGVGNKIDHSRKYVWPMWRLN